MTIFDWVNQLLVHKKHWNEFTEDEQKKFSPFIINRWLSMDKDFIEVVKKISGDKWKIGTTERLQFYKEAKEAYTIISTTDARAFGCFILTKGVIKPDGSIW